MVFERMKKIRSKWRDHFEKTEVDSSDGSGASDKAEASRGKSERSKSSGAGGATDHEALNDL